jgi:hypothetical protein
LADGIFVSSPYLLPEDLTRSNRLIDDGAKKAGREPAEIRRGYNLMGVIDLGRPDTRLDEPKPRMIYGAVEHWVGEIVRVSTGITGRILSFTTLGI